MGFIVRGSKVTVLSPAHRAAVNTVPLVVVKKNAAVFIIRNSQKVLTGLENCAHTHTHTGCLSNSSNTAATDLQVPLIASILKAQ